MAQEPQLSGRAPTLRICALCPATCSVRVHRIAVSVDRRVLVDDPMDDLTYLPSSKPLRDAHLTPRRYWHSFFKCSEILN